jgi:hypothetical protein
MGSNCHEAFIARCSGEMIEEVRFRRVRELFKLLLCMPAHTCYAYDTASLILALLILEVDNHVYFKLLCNFTWKANANPQYIK